MDRSGYCRLQAPTAAENPWRSALYRMRGEPLPIYLFGDATRPGASLWAGARRRLRSDGPEATWPLVASIPGPAFLQTAVAALFSNRPLLVVEPECDRAPLLELPAGPRVWTASRRALRAVGVDDLARVDDDPPEYVDIPSLHWHEPQVLRAVLRSLVTPSHVLCCGLG